MKTSRTKPGIVLAILFLLSACTVYQTVPIEIFRPEEARLPSGASRIGWLYRNFKYAGDTLQHYYRDGDQLRRDLPGKRMNIDSLAAAACLTAASRSFSENGISGEAVFFPLDIMPRVTGEKLSPLPPSLMMKLAQPAKAGIIISLETFSWFYSRFPGDSQSAEARQVELAGVWAVYDAVTGKLRETKSMVDTVYWDAAESGNDKLPPRIPAIELAAEHFGEKYARRFYSEWLTTDRLLVIPPLEEFRMAAEMAGKQDWEGAREIWERYAGDRFGKLAITACYNLALDAEIHDKLNDAGKWISRASALAATYHNRKEMELVNSYQTILTRRREEIRRLEEMAKP